MQAIQVLLSNKRKIAIYGREVSHIGLKCSIEWIRWSCGTIPTAQDPVRINSGHTITLPEDYAAKARSVEIQGEVRSGLNAALQLGQD